MCFQGSTTARRSAPGGSPDLYRSPNPTGETYGDLERREPRHSPPISPVASLGARPGLAWALRPGWCPAPRPLSPARRGRPGSNASPGGDLGVPSHTGLRRRFPGPITGISQRRRRWCGAAGSGGLCEGRPAGRLSLKGFPEGEKTCAPSVSHKGASPAQRAMHGPLPTAAARGRGLRGQPMPQAGPAPSHAEGY